MIIRGCVQYFIFLFFDCKNLLFYNSKTDESESKLNKSPPSPHPVVRYIFELEANLTSA